MIAQEMRQRCPRLWLEMGDHPWQYPRLEKGEARWVMKKVAKIIERDFYPSETNTSFKETNWLEPNKSLKKTNWLEPNKGLKKTIWHENACEECEACQLARCPWVRRMPQPNRRRGRDGYNINNLENIEWVLLDENEHVFKIK